MAQPVWVTPAGDLGTIAESLFFQVPIEATDSDAGGTAPYYNFGIRYALLFSHSVNRVKHFFFCLSSIGDTKNFFRTDITFE